MPRNHPQLTEHTPVRASLKLFPKAIALEAIRGIQAGRECYSAKVGIADAINLFVFQPDTTQAGQETQRTINLTRAKKIARYVAQNLESYIFASIVVSIDGDLDFKAIAPTAHIGTLYVSEGARFIINDGQHRMEGLRIAMQIPQIADYLRDESISVDFHPDLGLRRSRQIFADLNLNLSKPSKSISHYFDHRDQMAELTRAVIEAIPQFRGLVHHERTQLPTTYKGKELWTFKALYDAISATVHPHSEIDADRVIDLWTAIANAINEWQPQTLRMSNSPQLRLEQICFNAIGMVALGKVAHQLLTLETPEPLLERMASLSWNRSHPQWQGVCVFDGKLRKTTQTIEATASLIWALINNSAQP